MYWVIQMSNQIPYITIEIDEDGHVEAQYDGFDGDACYGESDRLKQALSTQGIERITKSEKPTSGSRPQIPVRPPVVEPPIRKTRQETGRE